MTEPGAPGIAWAGVTMDYQDPERTDRFWSALLDAAVRPAGPVPTLPAKRSEPPS